IDENYEPFVLALRKPLSNRKKLLTAAVAYFTRDRFSDKALEAFDFINMMAYDKTGPWRPHQPGEHSPISYALDHLYYWRDSRKVDPMKLIIGVPFYGYGFGKLPDTDSSFQ